MFFLQKNNQFFAIDIKTAKPNIASFEDYKRTLLKWIAMFLHKDQNSKIRTIIAIPYNPYEPKPYQRWTLRGMMDEDQLLVGREFWNFLAGCEVYEKLLRCFHEAGLELREELDGYFSRFSL